MADIKLKTTSAATVASTELNSLASSGGVLCTEYDNGTNLYIYGLFLLTVTFGTSPTTGNLVNVYLVPAIDGTNYAYTGGGTTFIANTMYIGGFPVYATTSTQRIPLGIDGSLNRPVMLPPCKFKLYVINNSGQAFPSSGSTITMLPIWGQSV